MINPIHPPVASLRSQLCGGRGYLRCLMIHRRSRHLFHIIMSLILLSLLSACADQPAVTVDHFTIGLITNSQNGLRNIQGFKDGMREFGYVEEQTVTYLFDGNPTAGEDLPDRLQEMVAAEVDLIFTAGTPTGVAAYEVTNGGPIPVVFGVIADPIAAGVMTDLTQPGGNMTGVMLSDNQGRRLELFQELVPTIRRVFIPYDPTDSASTSALAQLTELAPLLDLEIIEGNAQNGAEVDALLNDFPDQVDAIFLVPGTTVNEYLPDIVAIALERRLPLSGPSTAQVEEGALMTYGFTHHEAGAQAARIADQILKGGNPGEIPVEIAEFFLVINLPAAEAIGIVVSDAMLQRANIIIRDDN